MAAVYEVLHHISIAGVFVFVVSNMAAIGLGHTIGEILAPLQDARLFLGTLCANFVILPLASFGLAVGLRLDNALAEGLILMGMASGAPFVPKLTELAGGNLRFAVATMGLLTAGTIVYIPPVLPLLMPEVTVSPLTVARPLLLFVLLPLILGLATKAQSENLARWLKPILDRISNATLIPVIVLVAALNVDNILHVFGTGGILAALLLVFVGLLVGWLLEQPLELKEQSRRAQLIVGQILRLRVPQGERQRGRGLVSGVVEVVLRVTERRRPDGQRDLVPDRRGPLVRGLLRSDARQSRDDDERHNP